MGETVGRQALRAVRVDLFQQPLGRDADLWLLPQQGREEKSDPPTGLLRLPAVIREQIPDVRFTVELQRQLPVDNIPARTVEGSCVLPALAPAEHKVGVRGSAQARGTGNHVHGVVVIELAQMVDEQDGNTVSVCQCFEDADVPVVIGVGIGLIARCPNALEGVDDHQAGSRVRLEKLLHLLH